MLVTTEDLSLSAVAEVLSCFQPLQGLERQSFLSAPKLPRLLRAVPPASALCKTFAAAKVHGYRVAFSGPCRCEEFVCSYFDAMCEDLQLKSCDFEKLYLLHEALPSVYSLHTDSRLVLGSTFVRIQEYYESPDAQIRHHAFELDQYKDWYRKRHGKGFDYYLEWPGFNVPSWVLNDLRDGKVGCKLRPQEEALLKVWPSCGQYLIGSCEEDMETLQHEMAHGLYATNEAYREAVTQSLEDLPQGRWQVSRQRLLELGYADDPAILNDEIQAYMVEGKCFYEEGELDCPITGEVQAAIRRSFEDDGYMRIEEGGNPAAPASGSKGRKAHEHAKYHCNRTMINFGLSKQVPNKDSTARDHLANERTFLAWLRTGLALSGAGFGVIKFLPGVSTNLILGFFLIGVGICVLAFGALRYFDVMEALENGVFAIDTGVLASRSPPGMTNPFVALMTRS
ncbi:unnamed protein product [Durusdinium trenchii]|uniref:DUF202 domain-containing protein n=1 Tax=Durusdinium trenchii TaxID=1381693 RepID=A0ABP0R5K1_9DINO